MPVGTQTGVRLAQNLVQQYGVGKARRLVQSKVAGLTAAQVAPDYGVSPRRVRQWWSALGASKRVYSVHPDVAALATDNRVESR